MTAQKLTSPHLAPWRRPHASPDGGEAFPAPAPPEPSLQLALRPSDPAPADAWDVAPAAPPGPADHRERRAIVRDPREARALPALCGGDWSVLQGDPFVALAPWEGDRTVSP